MLQFVTPNELSRSFYLFDYPIQVVDDARVAATSPSMKTPHEIMAAVNDFRRVCAEDHNFLLQQCYKPNRPPAPSTSSSTSSPPISSTTSTSTGAPFHQHQQQQQHPNMSNTPNATMQGNPGSASNANLGDVLTQLLQQHQQQGGGGGSTSPAVPSQNPLMMPSNLYNSNAMSNLYGHSDNNNNNNNNKYNKGSANNYKSSGMAGYGFAANNTNTAAAAAPPHIHIPLTGPAYQAPSLGSSSSQIAMSLPPPPPPPISSSSSTSSTLMNSALGLSANNLNKVNNNNLTNPSFPFYQPNIAHSMHNTPFGQPRHHGPNMSYHANHSLPPHHGAMNQQQQQQAYSPFGGAIRTEPEPIEINV